MYEDLKFRERGSNVQLYPWIAFVNPEKIELKDHIIISEFCWIHGGRRTVIGNFIHISPYSSVVGGGHTILEDFVGLSAGVRIISGSEMTGGEGLTNPTIPPPYRAVKRSFVHCQRHVFLASDVVVHPGVTIGEGAVVGSNSVVTKDIEAWTINMGSPARAVGRRPSDTIKRLEREAYANLGVRPFKPGDLSALKVTEVQLPQGS